MEKQEKKYLLKCTLRVSPNKVDFSQSKRPIISEEGNSITFSIPDPLELKNSGKIKSDKINTAYTIIHYWDKPELITYGYCYPHQLEEIEKALWQEVITTAQKSADDFEQRRMNLLAIISESPIEIE